jgi:hypothetical protein
MRRTIVNIALGILLGIAAALVIGALSAHARDDGRYAISSLKQWFDGLASGNGLCCSLADGQAIEDVDWDTNGASGRYRVRVAGQWIDVPDAAVVTVPNKFGRAVVWPYQDTTGATQIRCFLPGAGA